MADADIYSLLMAPDEPTAQEKAAALANMLRGQQAGAAQDRRAAALFSLGNNPLGANLVQQANADAGALTGQANQAQSLLATAAQHRAGNLLQQSLKDLELRRQAQLKAVEMANSNEQKELDRQQRLEGDRILQGGQRVFMVTPGGDIFNTHNGQMVPPPQPAPTPDGTPAAKPIPPLGSRARKQLDQQNAALANDISLSNQLNKPLQERLQASERVKAVGIDPATGKPKTFFTPNDVAEMGAATASLLAGGGHPSEGLIHQIIPKTAGMGWAQIQQYFMDNPADADAGKFVQMWLKQAEREEGTIQRQILRNQLGAVGSHKQFIAEYPEMAWNTLGARGIRKEMFDPKTGEPLAKYLGDASVNPGAGEADSGDHAGQVHVQIPGSPAGWVPAGRLKDIKAKHPNLIEL